MRTPQPYLKSSLCSKWDCTRWQLDLSALKEKSSNRCILQCELAAGRELRLVPSLTCRGQSENYSIKSLWAETKRQSAKVNETLRGLRGLCVFLSPGLRQSCLRARSSLFIWVTISSELQRNELPGRQQKRRLWRVRRRKERQASQNSCTRGKVCGWGLRLAAKRLFMESFSCVSRVSLEMNDNDLQLCWHFILCLPLSSFLKVWGRKLKPENNTSQKCWDTDSGSKWMSWYASGCGLRDFLLCSSFQQDDTLLKCPHNQEFLYTSFTLNRSYSIISCNNSSLHNGDLNFRDADLLTCLSVHGHESSADSSFNVLAINYDYGLCAVSWGRGKCNIHLKANEIMRHMCCLLISCQGDDAQWWRQRRWFKMSCSSTGTCAL